ncbi:hypothetical protein EIK77_003491 [Talaromyces pinophilus]|nr:hypothetical protein EIK77_003491 [Talaromyces pinophilus]
MTAVEKSLSKLTLSKEGKGGKVSEKEKDIKDSSSDGDAPPTYEEHQQQLDDEQFVVDIPPLSFPDPGLAEETTVEKDRCILHLKLLASLADLRETISTIDGLFGIHDSQAFKFEEETRRTTALIRIREKRWAVYTARAVDRYADWWTHCVPVSEASPTIDSVQSESYAALTSTPPSSWLAKDLPPLEDCLRGGRMRAWATDFPWQLIDAAIDNRTLDYNPGDEAVEHFTKNTGHQWENLDDPDEKELKCLNCSRPFKVAWTFGDFGTDPDTPFDKCPGYADKDFLTYCQSSDCRFKHDHQALRVARFHQDVEDLLQNYRPMPGTYLNLQGIPHYSNANDSMFPNHLIRASKGVVSEYTKPKGSVQDMTGVKKLIESLMGDIKVLVAVAVNSRSNVIFNNRSSYRLKREQRISIRRMMSHYWDNGSIFGLDLVGAVIRQGTFIQKMDNLDWIHSPAVAATMQRLIRKYDVFFQIMISHANKMAVPTLDVDLAWHTHQMSPSRYFMYSHAKTSKVRVGVPAFMDHDDKVDEAELSDAFQWTSKKYFEITNGELYSECTCWYCEATRESFLYPTLSIPSSSTRRARTLAESLHDDPHISSEPDKNPHISAHNAVRAETSNRVKVSNANYKAMRLRQMWDKSRRRNLKRQQKQARNGNGPNKNDDKKSSSYNPAVDPYYPMVYGYPFFMPYYAPYMADPCIYAGAYPCNPACMSAVAGAYGNCAAGTCGASVASGACAGAGGGGCGGGAGGGCGGGGGGGGGCGGGGGGGGGGCGGGGGG